MTSQSRASKTGEPVSKSSKRSVRKTPVIDAAAHFLASNWELTARVFGPPSVESIEALRANPVTVKLLRRAIELRPELGRVLEPILESVLNPQTLAQVGGAKQLVNPRFDDQWASLADMTPQELLGAESGVAPSRSGQRSGDSGLNPANMAPGLGVGLSGEP